LKKPAEIDPRKKGGNADRKRKVFSPREKKEKVGGWGTLLSGPKVTERAITEGGNILHSKRGWPDRDVSLFIWEKKGKKEHGLSSTSGEKTQRGRGNGPISLGTSSKGGLIRDI